MGWGGLTCSQEFENNLSSTIRPFLKENRTKQTSNLPTKPREKNLHPYPQAHTGSKQSFIAWLSQKQGCDTQNHPKTHCTHNGKSPAVFSLSFSLWTSTLSLPAFRPAFMLLPQSRFLLHMLWEGTHCFVFVGRYISVCTGVHRTWLFMWVLGSWTRSSCL